jgi:hypothetical protein
MQRVYELSRDVGVSAQKIMAFLQSRGTVVRSASSTVSEADAAAVLVRWPVGGRDGDEPVVDENRRRTSPAPALAPA